MRPTLRAQKRRNKYTWRLGPKNYASTSKSKSKLKSSMEQMGSRGSKLGKLQRLRNLLHRIKAQRSEAIISQTILPETQLRMEGCPPLQAVFAGITSFIKRNESGRLYFTCVVQKGLIPNKISGRLPGRQELYGGGKHH